MKDTVSLDGLRVFLAVYRAGSFTGAAADLGIAQPSVSGQIASLERKLGYQLFDRTSTGARPTDRARDLAERVSGAVDQLVAATDDAVARDSLGERTVVVAGPAEFLSEVVLPHLVALLPAQVRLRARFGGADDLVEALASGAVDILVSTVPVRRAAIATAPLIDEEFALVAHPKWLGSVGVDAIPLLAYAEDLPIIRRYWHTVFGRKPTGLEVRLVVPDLRVLARLAAAGQGMTVLPTYLADPYLAAGTLVPLAEPELPPLNTLYLATRRRVGSPDPVVEALRSAMVGVVARREILRLRTE
jgi:DNA-binding transcriptional LysR family regulator